MELTEDPILPGVTQIFCLGERHSGYHVPPWRYLFKDCGGGGPGGHGLNDTRFPTVGPRLPSFIHFYTFYAFRM